MTICSISDCANNLNKNSILYGGILRYEPDILANGSREAQIIVNVRQHAIINITNSKGTLTNYTLILPEPAFIFISSEVILKWGYNRYK